MCTLGICTLVVSHLWLGVADLCGQLHVAMKCSGTSPSSRGCWLWDLVCWRAARPLGNDCSGLELGVWTLSWDVLLLVDPEEPHLWSLMLSATWEYSTPLSLRVSVSGLFSSPIIVVTTLLTCRW